MTYEEMSELYGDDPLYWPPDPRQDDPIMGPSSPPDSPAYGCFAGLALLASALVSGSILGWAAAGVWAVVEGMGR